jgi:hypothetical protein
MCFAVHVCCRRQIIDAVCAQRGYDGIKQALCATVDPVITFSKPTQRGALTCKRKPPRSLQMQSTLQRSRARQEHTFLAVVHSRWYTK